MSKRILIAGVGNIFFGDDAFGVETARQLMQCPLPESVRVIDFGIRSHDLAYTITDGYDIVILVDATARGAEPGTVYLIEADVNDLREPDHEMANAHSLNPAGVLQMVSSLGGWSGRLYIVGCEPAVLETEDGEIGLSTRVQAAVPKAIEMIRLLLGDLAREEKEPGLVEA
ncbi:hydrogenase maturation protease [Pedosphaera parvula]|uniref:Hydrogenase maturation protease n=1 Tax=Pedosphaera parvula (strain Ellin514) TaxID=320771 RepID=B9XAS0_PEDPL|nr:hydrogenase maturation protease [Pedosphaera parvula]EEF63105.1 hydrogenase maturation protease [Pedosphaera parvula Ellin514]